MRHLSFDMTRSSQILLADYVMSEYGAEEEEEDNL